MKFNQPDCRRVVIAFRECPGRTITFVRKTEAEGVEIAKARVASKAMIFADEATPWDAPDTIPAVSLTARFAASVGTPRALKATSHAFATWASPQSRKYLHHYTNRAAWMEDHRRRSNGANAFSLLGGSLAHTVHRVWNGYQQRTAS